MSADGDGGGFRVRAFAGSGMGGRRPGTALRAQRQQVADGVGGGGEAKGLETLAQPSGAGLLGKGRRGNGCDGELEVGDVALVAGKPIEQAVNARVGGEAVYLLGERAGLSALGLPAKPGTERLC